MASGLWRFIGIGYYPNLKRTLVSKFVVGVSGGIGSGKTTVTDLFSALGVDVVDADVIAREVVNPDSVALKAIVEKWGVGVLLANGNLNRANLREIVFNDDESKDWLNTLLHPLIREQMQRQTQNAKSQYCLLSIPLLVENHLQHMVDRILIVDVSEKTQLERTIARDKSNEASIKAIMAAQVNRSQRLAVADDVIENEGGITELQNKVKQLHTAYLALSKEK